MSDQPSSASTWSRSWRSVGPHPFVLDRMSRIPFEQRAGIKVLDLPAGKGVIALPLRAAGFNVVACDLFPRYFEQTMENVRGQTLEEAFQTLRRGRFSPALRDRLFRRTNVAVPTDVRCVEGDMEDRLPFADGEFDFVVSMEGIEHVKDRHQALAEFRRVLKPRGTLIISTPNMLSVRARLAGALNGHRTFKGNLDEHTGIWGRSPDGSRVYHGHAFLINYFQLRYSLYHCGFRIRQLLPSNKSPSSVALWPMLYPLVALFTRRSLHAGLKAFQRGIARGDIPGNTQPPFDEMYRHLLSPRMLLTTVMILEAEAV